MSTDELKPEDTQQNQEQAPETEVPSTEEAIALEDLGEFPLDPEVVLAEEKNKYMRLYSDFENYKRRMAKERLELFQTAGKDIIISMLPVMDDFERALKATESLATENKAAWEGFQLIQKKMQSTLEARGLKAVNSVGEVFDVEFHEAITRFPAPSADMKGKVVDEVEKGYLLNEHVIRFAKVVVGE